ncbi:MAG: SDR family NAD(P)-dependent oxidoreductase [Acidobacteriaceae bacterium]|nr:SDR family NAD(P)-dependent oxidoreductase [Acidobacteriaceae bacterium]
MSHETVRVEGPRLPEDEQGALHIAIVGMAGRFPGSDTLEEFWLNLKNGVEGIHFLSDAELQALGVPRPATKKKQFVNAAALVGKIDQFDAAFFGYTPREAELMDPQHRLFLECAWEAMECAGYHAETYAGLIGVYAGTSLSSYLLYNVLPNMSDMHSETNFEAMIGNDKDFLSTRVAYKLNLKGPAIDVQTGCSTSLVAVHLACQSLLCYQCDMALAGGVSIQVPQRSGYYYVEDGIHSPDGHCRAFDAQARGTMFGNGLGIVVLKRLSDALHDRDHIHAVIRGSAINNDGARKVGYTAPSVEGQSNVITAAQTLAGVTPQTITYIECHGTGTNLGDPVEVLALANAFRNAGNRKRFCALGAVKTNIGHLDAAAGVAGLIKTVLALKHKLLPPTLHFESPNPQIDFDHSPFFVNSSLREWTGVPLPRRAGVSSFGIGGTNAHVIVQEAPSALSPAPSRSHQLLLLSAKTPDALEAVTSRLAGHLRHHPHSELADAAYTLAVGRKSFDFRRVVVASDSADALQALQANDSARVYTRQYKEPARPVVFMFPGGGAQYAQMGFDLYHAEPVFRDHVDLCAGILHPWLGFDIRTFLYPADKGLNSSKMKQPIVGLPALLVTELALAKLWISWGIVPHAFIGHSLGEYTAAALAGVFSIEDALALVVTRARLFERLQPGAMAAVPLPASDVEPLLGDALSLAAVNSETQCLVSGAQAAIDDFIRRLEEDEIECRGLQIDVASHSHMVEPILEPFADFLRTLELHAPQVPYISNVTGDWITEQQATNPDYWVRHLRETVLFGPGLQKLLSSTAPLLLEVGPGHTLATLAKTTVAAGLPVTSMRHPYDHQSDVAFLLAAAGKLWLAGVPLDWRKFYSGEQRMRVPLPSYPFEQQRYWMEPPHASHAAKVTLDKVDDIDEWFYAPSWQLSPLPFSEDEPRPEMNQQPWLIFLDEEGLGSWLAEKLLERNAEVFVVRRSSGFQRVNDKTYLLNPERPEDYVRLLQSLEQVGMRCFSVLHFWSFTGEQFNSTATFSDFQHLGMYSLVYFAQAIARLNLSDPMRVWVISSDLHKIETKDRLIADKATLLSPCIIMPQEYENLSCWSIDVDVAPRDFEKAGDRILAEIQARSADKVVAIRGEHRWLRKFQQVNLTETNAERYLRPNGVYLITGGLGGIGLQIAGFLAQIQSAKLALVERSLLPAEDQWDAWLLEHPEDDLVSGKIAKVRQLTASGAQVMVVSADVANSEQMQAAIDRVIDRWKHVDGVIHTAGVAGEAAMHLIADMSMGEFDRQLRAKVWGSKTLAPLIEAMRPKFCLLFSSNAALFGGLGSVAYSAGSLFMDAFAETLASTRGTRWISADWDPWLVRSDERIHETFDTALQKHALNVEESRETFRRVVASASAGRVVISTGNLPLRLDFWSGGRAGLHDESGESDGATERHARPVLETSYVPPGSQLESTIAEIWQKILGIDRLGVHDNFFDLGGNSLIGLRMITAVKKKLEIDLPIIALFEGPTVSALCQRIEARQFVAPSFVEDRDRGERRRHAVLAGNDFERDCQASSPR